MVSYGCGKQRVTLNNEKNRTIAAMANRKNGDCSSLLARCKLFFQFDIIPERMFTKSLKSPYEVFVKGRLNLESDRGNCLSSRPVRLVTAQH